MNVTIPAVQGAIFEIVPGKQIIGGTSSKNNNTVTLEGNLWALNLDPANGEIGKLLWNKTFVPPKTIVADANGGVFGYGKMTGPQVDSANSVFLFSESITRNRWGYDLNTMQQLWKTTEPEPQWQFYGMSTSIYKNKLLSYGYGGVLIAYDIRSGNVLWKWSSGTVGFEGYYESAEGERLEVPYLGRAERPAHDEVSLLELRGDTFVAERFESLAIDGGLLRITGLGAATTTCGSSRRTNGFASRSPGRAGYPLAGGVSPLILRLGTGTCSAKTGNWRARRAAAADRGGRGRRRDGEDPPATQLEIARVHVFAARYQPAYAAFDYLGRVRDAEPSWMEPRKLETLYVAGRNIGDEYRYILDRKYAKKFPGNMLERPSLLLNPWAVRSTETGEQTASGGEAFEGKGQGFGGHGGRGPGAGVQAAEHGDFINLDFLAQASAVLVNLAADDQGVITIPRRSLGKHQHLQILAVDPRGTTFRSVCLPEIPGEALDLRLADGLDPKLHFAQQKQVSAVDPKQPFVIGDITSARLETYDSLASVYAYATLSSNPQLIEFGFLRNWPNLKPEEKRERYSKYACHELHFFLYHKDPEFFRTLIAPT